MKPSIQEVLRAVIETLSNQVLPELEPASWPASNIRACTLLLISVEDRIAQERPLLRETNALMRRLLCDVAEGLRPLDLNASVFDSLSDVLGTFSDVPETADLDLLGRANEAYKEQLTKLSHQAAEKRSHPEGVDDNAFRSRLHEILTIINERETALLARANQQSPL